jgi:hypothetical protein
MGSSDQSELLFSHSFHRQNRAQGYPDRPLGSHLGIDFNILTLNIALDEAWLGQMQRGEISQADLQHAVRSYNNVAAGITVVMSAIKPAGRF